MVCMVVSEELCPSGVVEKAIPIIAIVCSFYPWLRCSDHRPQRQTCRSELCPATTYLGRYALCSNWRGIWTYSVPPRATRTWHDWAQAGQERDESKVFFRNVLVLETRGLLCTLSMMGSALHAEHDGVCWCGLLGPKTIFRSDLKSCLVAKFKFSWVLRVWPASVFGGSKTKTSRNQTLNQIKNKNQSHWQQSTHIAEQHKQHPRHTHNQN